MRYFPLSIPAGVTFERSLCLDDYPASDGWSLTVALRGPQAINLTSTADGDQHDLTASAATTATWTAGLYSYSIRATKAGEVHQIEQGTIEIEPDVAAIATGVDQRSHARRTLDAIEALLENRATIDQERYRINNRELYRMPIAELLKFRDQYRAEVQREEIAARGGNGFRAVRVVL
jgi:hypothetical protein